MVLSDGFLRKSLSVVWSCQEVEYSSTQAYLVLARHQLINRSNFGEKYIVPTVAVTGKLRLQA